MRTSSAKQLRKVEAEAVQRWTRHVPAETKTKQVFPW